MSQVMTNFNRSAIKDNVFIPGRDKLIISQSQIPTSSQVMYQYVGNDSVHAFTDKERESFVKKKSAQKNTQKSNNTSKNTKSDKKYTQNSRQTPRNFEVPEKLNWKGYKNQSKSNQKKSKQNKYPRYSDERASQLIADGYQYNNQYKVFYRVLPNGYIEYQYQ